MVAKRLAHEMDLDDMGNLSNEIDTLQQESFGCGRNIQSKTRLIGW
jgi:hypothetical protein